MRFLLVRRMALICGMISALVDVTSVSETEEGRRRMDPHRKGVRRCDLGFSRRASYVGKPEGRILHMMVIPYYKSHYYFNIDADISIIAMFG